MRDILFVNYNKRVYEVNERMKVKDICVGMCWNVEITKGNEEIFGAK